MPPEPDAALFSLLSHLWLHEPDAGRIALLSEAARSRGIALDAPGTPKELAAAYADLFLLNVPPYGTAYTDRWGEINTFEAQQVAALYEARGYAPAELRSVGAPDHLGLCLGFLAHAAAGEPDSFRGQLTEWAPVCCLAAERDPSAHPFYRALARRTRAALFALGVPAGGQPMRFVVAGDAPGGSDGEVRLRDVTRFLLTPARSGVYLSRARLGACALALGMRLPFGSRFEVAQWLFTAAGEGGRLVDLLRALDAETRVWDDAYRDWAEHAAAWRPFSASWLARTAATRRMLAGMEQQARDGVAVEVLDPAEAEAHLSAAPAETEE